MLAGRADGRRVRGFPKWGALRPGLGRQGEALHGGKCREGGREAAPARSSASKGAADGGGPLRASLRPCLSEPRLPHPLRGVGEGGQPLIQPRASGGPVGWNFSRSPSDSWDRAVATR